MARNPRSLLPALVRRRYAVRLGAALLLAIALMVAFGAVISTQTSATLEEDVRGDLTALSASQAQQFDSGLTNTRRLARLGSSHPTLATGSPTEIRAHLESMIDTEQVPENVVAVHYLNTTTGTFETSTSDRFVGVSPADQGAPFAENAPAFEGPQDTYLSKPFSVPIADHPVIAVLSPVAGTDDAVLVYMINLQDRADAISAQRADVSTVVVDGDGQYVAHPNASRILTEHEGNATAMASLAPGASEYMAGDGQVMGMTRLETTDWVVMTHADTESAFALASQINSDLVGLLLFAIINLSLVGVTIGTTTVVSLRRLSERARAMGDGDMAIDLSTVREDEFGTLYAALDDMRTSIREKIAEAEDARAEAEEARAEAEDARADAEAARAEAVEESEVVQELNERLEEKAAVYRDVLAAAADGDLTRRVEPESENEAMESVGEAINETLGAIETTIADTQDFARAVREASSDVGDNAAAVDDASRQVRDSIGEILDGASEQSDRLQSAAEEMEDLSATAEEVASSAQQVAETSRSAAAVGEEGRTAATDAVDEMAAIDELTDETVAEISALADDLDEIGDIVELITEIVEQTNMLALNASIEAARADAGGDGFAVVADEIKNLAEETREAATDIETRIERIQEQAGETVDTVETTSERITAGVDTVEDAISALERMVEHTKEVDVGIQEIDDATEQQANTAQRTMTTINDLSEISTQTAREADTVADAAAEQTESIEEVATSARQLGDRAGELDAALDRFTVSDDATTTGGTAQVARGDD